MFCLWFLHGVPGGGRAGSRGSSVCSLSRTLYIGFPRGCTDSCPYHMPQPRVLSSMYDISAFLWTVILTQVRCSLSMALICVWWLKMLHTFVKHLPPTCALHRSACGLTCPFLLGYLLRWTYFFAWLMLCSLSSADQYWKGFPTLWTASSLCWVPLAAEAF